MANHAEHLKALFWSAYRINDSSRAGDINIHGSDLINFCPRAYWLCRKHNHSYHSHSHPGLSMGYTFDMGHALQRMQVQRLMTQQVLFGAWECRHCKHLEVGLQPGNHPCPKCKCKSWKHKDLGIEIPFPLKTEPKGQFVVRVNIDFVIATSPMSGFIVDAKSIKAEDFDELRDPHIDYKRQLWIYKWAGNHPKRRFVGTLRDPLMKDFKLDPHQSVLSYCVKGARKEPFKFFQVQQNKDFIKKIEGNLQALAEHIEKDTPPEQICKSQANLMARDCTARTLCFPGKGR